MSLKLAE